ncbi:MAG: TetR/AcrR family transcriptional regulator [Thermoplasmata archaeon]|nr:TetR/AcrR family transcriptional regulator [Thermoplasmata archaeon]
MPRSELANREIRRESAHRIFEAARIVFAREGRAATMEEVAEEAGISQGLAYRYFPSKQALYIALIKDALHAPESPRARLEGADSPGARLATMVSNMVILRRDCPELTRIPQLAAGDKDLPSAFRRELMQHGQRMIRSLRQRIVDAQESGEISRDDPDQLVVALLSTLDGLSRIPAGVTALGGASSFPNPEIILRMLSLRLQEPGKGPGANRKSPPSAPPERGSS